MATKASILAEGGRDGDTLEDVDEFFDKSLVKDQFELAMRMAEVARSTSEWHRRMTSENLSQSGQLVDLSHMPVGAEAYVYKPPSQQEAINRGRRAKHIDHYIGPGRIVKHIGTRSVVVSIKDCNNIDREYQRDAGMVLLKKPKPMDIEPEFTREPSLGTRASSKDDLNSHPIKEGEFLILKDDPNATDWYCAEVRTVLVDRIEVNYYTTQTPSLENYGRRTTKDKKERLGEALFLRTWCLSGGKGLPSTTPPATKHARMNHLWWGKIPLEVISDHILIRDVGLNASGRLDKITLNLAAKLEIPHHVGAGGEEDFADKETFQKHIKRVSNRNKKLK
jgi:hypothetical protein